MNYNPASYGTLEKVLPKTYLISIAISKFKEFEHLPNAVNDSIGIKNSLIPKYKVELHEELHEEDFTYQRVQDSFKQLSKKITKEDSLVIFYNGHGEIENNSDLCWLHYHSEKKDPNTWFRADTMFSFINTLDIKHVALIVNCCNSGNLHKTTNRVFEETEGKSRLLLTAGKKNQNVKDSTDSSDYSPFTEGVKKCFDENKDVIKLSLNMLDDGVGSYLEDRDNQNEPILASFDGHQGGKFIFTLTEDDENYWNQMDKIGDIESYSFYLNRFKDGKKAGEARQRIEDLKNERDEWIKAIKEIKEKLEEFKTKSEKLKGLFQNDVITIIKDFDAKTQVLTDSQLIESDWLLTCAKGGLRDFEWFDRTYRKCIYTNQCKRIIEKLEKEKKANDAWTEIEKAKKRNVNEIEYIRTKRGLLNSFIKDFWTDTRVKVAREFEEDIKEFLDADNADKKKQVDLFKKYRLRSGKCEYKDLADKRIKQLEANNIFDYFDREVNESILKDDVIALYQLRERMINEELDNLKPIIENTSSFINNFEEKREKAFKEAEKEETLTGYLDFVEKYQEGNLVETVIGFFQKEEQSYYDECQRINPLNACKDYLTAFSAFEKQKIIELKYIRTVKELYKSLIEDSKAFENAKTIIELSQYISDVKNRVYIGNCLEDAKTKLSSLIFERDKQEAYEGALKSDDIVVCQKFLLDFESKDDPRNLEIEDKKKSLVRIKEREDLYDLILNESDLENKIVESEKFIRLYPEEEHDIFRNEIKAILSDCKAELEDKSNFEKLVKLNNSDDITDSVKMSEFDKYLHGERQRYKNEVTDFQNTLEKEIADDTEAYKKIEHLESIDEKIKALDNYLERKKPRQKEEASKWRKELVELRLDNEKFEHTKVNNDTKEGWLSYISVSKSDENKDFAIKRRKKLIFLEAEDKAYEEAINSNDKQPSFAYLEKYRDNGRYIKEVETQLGQILIGKTVEEVPIKVNTDLNDLSDKIVNAIKKLVVIFIISIVCVLAILAFFIFMKR